MSAKFWVDQFGNSHRVLAPRRLNYSQSGPKQLRDFIYQRDGYRCAICLSADFLVIDHIVSLKNGGSNHPDNLRTLCATCNTRKTGLFDARHSMSVKRVAGNDWVASIDKKNQVHFGVMLAERSVSVSLPESKAREMANAILKLLGDRP